MKRLWILLIIVPFFILSCAGSATSESAGQYIDSSATTTKVKASLVDQLGTSGLGIKVKTYKAIVQLSGFVDSRDTKMRAGSIAAGVDNVQRVINDIIVK